jgi:hypothetical protein
LGAVNAKTEKDLAADTASDPAWAGIDDEWVRISEEMAAGHAEYLEDPSKGIPAEEILDRIKARRASQPS